MQNIMEIAMKLFKYLNIKNIYSGRAPFQPYEFIAKNKPIIKNKIKEAFSELNFIREKLKDIPTTNFKLGIYHLRVGNISDAILRFKMVIFLTPEKAESYYYLARCFIIKGDTFSAKEELNTALSLKPVFPEAKYLLEKINNPDAINEIPAEIIAEHLEWEQPQEGEEFEDYKLQIDKALTTTILKNITDKNPNLEILELGAGDGGKGQILKDKEVTKRIVGVDVNKAKLLKAKKRTSNEDAVYSNLVLSDVSNYLDNSQYKFDVIIAGNVFSYIGSLDKIFRQIATSIKTGGLFALLAKNDYSESQYNLDRRNDIFIHSLEYIEGTLNKTGFVIEDKKFINIEGDDFAILIAKPR